MTQELTQLREALRRVKYEAVSLADAQVIALEALTAAQPEQTEREAFEAFAAKNEFGSYLIERKGDGYWSSRTQLMWMAWQARASLPTQPAQAAQVPEGWDIREEDTWVYFKRPDGFCQAVTPNEPHSSHSQTLHMLMRSLTAARQGAEHG